jgi:tRNA threonylcarbamoyladenosine biosynthesis protein TsaB
MLLLVVDTAGPTGGVLLAHIDLSDDRSGFTDQAIEILGVKDLHPRAFSTELIPAIAELLQANQRRLADVDAFGVVSGPGSFTGLRVGLSTVKAMAEATGKPILTLSRLALVASTAARLPVSGPANAPVHVVLDAGRGEFYHGVYRDAGKTRVAESFETLDVLAEGIRNQPGLVVVSEPAVSDLLRSIAGSKLREISAPTVRDSLPLALAAWQSGIFEDPACIDANYLRRSDAVVVSKLSGATQRAQSRDSQP